VQDRQQRDRHRPAEVETLPGPAEDRVSVAEVGVNVIDGAAFDAGQQRPGVGQHDRVVGVRVVHTN
jgi:hypothetical protein